MNLKRMTLSDGTCNFCDRGKLNTDGNGLVFPYKHVTIFEGTSVSFRFCDQCLVEFRESDVVVHSCYFAEDEDEQ